MTRPPISAELRRLVLIEAGHRCAIHTCRHPDVDVHHIDPWAKVKDHKFENLIALCPNCHRRAGAGEIDRLSLFQYKARLGAAVRVEPHNAYPTETGETPNFSWVDAGARWRTLVLRRNDLDRNFDAELEYPEFFLGTSKDRALNSLIFARTEAALDEFCARAIYNEEAQERQAAFHYDTQFNASFVVNLADEQFVSVRFSYFGYSGGAHGFHYAEVMNFDLRSFRDLNFSDLFSDVASAIVKVSAFAIRALLDPTDERHPRDDHWIRQGAGEDPKNFERFNLTPYGLLLTFDEYQVGCYAESSSEVLIPWARLYMLLTERLQRIIDQT